ncbi:MAG TPA: glycosyltransferase [Methylomirabilota bacterium]|nr:glycosyltransferase [Methylomirabilota bacterium]
MSAPSVSVLMAVYNGEPWLGEALGSVLEQSLKDLELIVVDDGSTDGTAERLAAIRDPRLSVLKQSRGGQTAALNRALRAARAPLVARIDADDVALPERLARQAAFLSAHHEVGLLGTAAREIAPSGGVVETLTPPCEDRDIRRALMRANPFIHSSVMFRRSTIDRVGLYDESFAVAQDYELWLRMSRVTRLANLPEPLVLRRLAPGRLSSARDSTRLRDELVAKLRAVRTGTIPPWSAVFMVKPLGALLLPTPIRRAARSVLAGRQQ